MTPPRRIYAVAGVPPEVQAYAMARYSRSSRGMLESIQELNREQTEKFLNTFYFQYGHSSIADLAHLVFGLEQVSLLAAIAIVDEQVWDGQERSTRYQPFRSTGWYQPPEVAGTAAADLFGQTASGLFTAYEQVSQSLTDFLADSVPRPEDLPEPAYRRTLRARAFDVARALLPLATNTSLGQVVSARVVERQISRLMSSPYPELRSIGGDLKRACERPAEAPLDRTEISTSEGEVSRGVTSWAAAPTLVKYAMPSAYFTSASHDLTSAAVSYLAAAGLPDRSHAVELAEPSSPLDEIVATLLYKHAPGGHSYRQVAQVVAGLSAAQKREVFELSMRDRGPHDAFRREHQSGYGFIFDVLMDIGSFRDLHRHRRTVQVQQSYTWDHGPDRPEDVFVAGLGESAALLALEAGLGDTYADNLDKAEQAGRQLQECPDDVSDYLIPLGYRTRSLFKMDWAQLAYLVELRTGAGGHFSYRRVAWSMYKALREREPTLAASLRPTDPFSSTNLLDR